MPTTVETTLPKRMYTFLKKEHGEFEEKEIITNIDRYVINTLLIPAGPKVYGCVIGYCSNSDTLRVWTRVPMGTESQDEVNVFDPEPIIEIKGSSCKIKTHC